MGPWGPWHDWEVSSLLQLQEQPTARPGAGQDLRPWAPDYTACPGVQEARRKARCPGAHPVSAPLPPLHREVDPMHAHSGGRGAACVPVPALLPAPRSPGMGAEAHISEESPPVMTHIGSSLLLINRHASWASHSQSLAHLPVITAPLWKSDRRPSCQ